MGNPEAFLIVTGLVAGFIDAIAGGGGLIALPAMSLIVGPGVEAIGTNKIASLAAAGIAFLVYLRKGHVDWKSSLAFTGAVGIGAFCGSVAAQWMPPAVFPWLLAVTCPLILYLVWKRDLWTERAFQPGGASKLAVIGSGLVVGFYDGVWGPGGGTLMFLALIFFAHLPLLTALAASKLANSVAAIVGLATYGVAGHVHFPQGAMLASGMLAGGFVGANLATRKASHIVRPVLVVIVILLVARVISTYV
ncbi:MAG: sulfite exporter TauE/SafE family protein [Gemmatimonadaceae bacterium]